MPQHPKRPSSDLLCEDGLCCQQCGGGNDADGNVATWAAARAGGGQQNERWRGEEEIATMTAVAAMFDSW